MPDPIPTAVSICIMATPPAPPKGHERVVIQRAASRSALALAAAKAGAPEGPWEQAEEGGRPLPTDGWHWSVTHDSHYVGAVVSRVAVGIDTEQLTLRRASLSARVLDESEQIILKENQEALLFTRSWCAKETVLKATGIGMAGLSRCKIRAQDGADLTLHLDGKQWQVVQRRKGTSLFAVTADSPTIHYDWSASTLSFDPWNENLAPE